MASYVGATEALVLDLGAQGANAGGCGGRCAGGIEEVWGTGGDRMTGDAAANVFRARSGRTRCRGSGNDALYGGDGDDR